MTWGMGQPTVPSRFLLEIPAELMVGPQLGGRDADDLDLDLVFGARRASRFGTPVRGGGGGRRVPTGERPARRARPRATPSGRLRDLAAKREAFAAGAPSGTLRRPVPAWDDEVDADAVAERALAAHRPPPRSRPGRSSPANASSATAIGSATVAGATASS